MSFPIKFYGCNGGNYTPGRQGHKIEYIAIHYTGTTASARNNVCYFHNNSRASASAHYFLDGSGTIWQSVRDNDTAWAVGDWNKNCRSISIETVSGGADFTSAEIAELTWLTQHLMKKYNVPASKVIRHYDVTGKHCPAPYVSSAKWKCLHTQITTGKSAVEPMPAPKPGTIDEDGWIGEQSVAGLQSQLGTMIDGIVSNQFIANKSYLPRCPEGPWDFGYNPSCGSSLIIALQKKMGVEADGWIGKQTVIAVQTWLRTICGYTQTIDGYLGQETAVNIQKALNANYFKTKPGIKPDVKPQPPVKPKPPKPKPPVKPKPVDLGDMRYWGSKMTKELQKQLGTTADGKISQQSTYSKQFLPNATTGWEFTHNDPQGSKCIIALQKKLGVKADGFFGQNSVKALQSFLRKKGYNIGKDGVDGYLGADTCVAFGKALQQGLFK